MTHRPLTIWRTGAVVLCASLMPVVPRAESGGAQRAQSSAASVARAQTAVEKATADRHVVMSDAAKRELAIEVARQEAAAPASPAAADATPEAKVDRLLARIGSAKAGSSVDVDQVRASVAADKTSQVKDTLEEDVKTQASAAGLTLPPDVQALLVQDLDRQTAGLAASGLPVDKIRAKNEIYLKAIAGRLQGAPITAASYTQMKAEIFQRFVNLRIESVPPGAMVRMNDVELGVTDIASQPLEPGKTYQFDFSMAGYRPAHRPFFVAAAEPTATLTEPLAADSATPAPGSDQPGGSTDGPGSSASFPYLYVIGGVVLGVLLLLARRR